jgi:carbonic anhydrase/acetyltransferase-like protein (isoleucine patch superfamily)
MLESYEGTHPEIDPSAFVHQTSVVIGRVQVGPESTLWPNTTLRGDDGDIVIGARTSIQDNTVIHMTQSLSNTRIGDQVTVGHGVVLHGCSVGDNVIVGMGSTLLDNASIGEFSIVGANSLVTQGKVFPPRSLIMGSPARVVRAITDKELEWIEYSWRRYVEQGKRYNKKGDSQDD